MIPFSQATRTTTSVDLHISSSNNSQQAQIQATKIGTIDTWHVPGDTWHVPGTCLSTPGTCLSFGQVYFLAPKHIRNSFLSLPSVFAILKKTWPPQMAGLANASSPIWFLETSTYLDGSASKTQSWPASLAQ